MKGLIAKLLAYAKYPRRTFLLLHPIRAAKFGLAYLAGRRLFAGSESKDERGKRRASRGRRPRSARRGRGGPEARRPADTAVTRPADTTGAPAP